MAKHTLDEIFSRKSTEIQIQVRILYCFWFSAHLLKTLECLIHH